jgi:peptide/nickel transport system permease protein
MNKHRQLRKKSYAARILRSTFRQWGARLGLVWIAVVAIVAVFAPFLANSRPLLVSQAGVISSPVVDNLTAGDVTWMVSFLAALLVLMLPMGLGKRVIAVVLIALVTSIVARGWFNPPQVVIYDQYREQVAAGTYDWQVFPLIPYSPRDYLRDQGDTGFQPPGSAHWMGTEENGADVLSRMIHASRIALGIGLVATGIAMVIGVIIGGLMGYFSGIVDMLGMRLVEIFEAIPTLFLLLTFVAFFGRSLYIMMVIIGLTSWTGYARYLRAEFLKLREQDYVQAAIAAGIGLPSVLFRHMLPNGIAPVLVAASFGFASAILAEATLSFLGLGLVDSPSWGQMLNQAVRSSAFNWWMAIFPGGAIFLTVFAYNLIGDSLRDAIDPRLGGSES